jgi:hypothetical protein
VITAIGLEMSHDAELAAIAVAGGEAGRHEVDLAYYGDAGLAAAEVNRLYETLEDNCGAWLDPQACGGLLAPLRAAGVWLHLLEAVDVSAASFAFKAEVRGRRVKTPSGGHEALREAMKYAMRRNLAAAFAFERRKVAVDMAPLNAAAFALFGLISNEGQGEPGAWLI